MKSLNPKLRKGMSNEEQETLNVKEDSYKHRRNERYSGMKEGSYASRNEEGRRRI